MRSSAQVNENNLKLEPFEASTFYELREDKRLEDKNIITLYNQGISLLNKYFRRKYHIPEIKLVSKCEDIQTYLDSPECLQKKNKGDFRVAFIFQKTIEIGRGQVRVTHSTPIIYFHEGLKEALLLNDTLGYNIYSEIAPKLNNSKIPLYIVPKKRQLDFASCHTDAIETIVELTAMSDNGDHHIPNFIDFLEDNSISKDGFNFTKLPNELLKTSQTEEFINDQVESDNKKVVHKQKNETLEQLLNRYQNEKSMFKSEYYKSPSSYLIEKGFKYADIIQIQFFIDQLEQKLQGCWSDKMCTEFIIAAKKELSNQHQSKPGHKILLDFAQNFMNSKYLFEDIILQINNEIDRLNKGSRSLFSIGMGDKAKMIKNALSKSIASGCNFNSVDEFLDYKANSQAENIQEEKTMSIREALGVSRVLPRFIKTPKAIINISTSKLKNS